MLDRGLKFYVQEEVALVNQQGHATHIILFRSNWT